MIWESQFDSIKQRDALIAIASLERKLKRAENDVVRGELLEKLATEQKLLAAVYKFVPDREPFDRVF